MTKNLEEAATVIFNNCKEYFPAKPSKTDVISACRLTLALPGKNDGSLAARNTLLSPVANGFDVDVFWLKLAGL